MYFALRPHTSTNGSRLWRVVYGPEWDLYVLGTSTAYPVYGEFLRLNDAQTMMYRLNKTLARRLS